MVTLDRDVLCPGGRLFVSTPTFHLPNPTLASIRCGTNRRYNGVNVAALRAAVIPDRTQAVAKRMAVFWAPAYLSFFPAALNRLLAENALVHPRGDAVVLAEKQDPFTKSLLWR